MGSHFLTLHQGSPEALMSLDPKEIPDGETREFVVKILTGDFTRDPKTHEDEDGGKFVLALRAMSERVSPEKVTFELYEDDERTPELWNFIWSEWEPCDPIHLPLSPYGVPAVTFKGPEVIGEYIEQFKSVASSGGYDERFVSSAVLDSMISFLERTSRRGSGVFVFIEY
jgi:hypothetical protein